jgi:hypothetical protein
MKNTNTKISLRTLARKIIYSLILTQCTSSYYAQSIGTVIEINSSSTGKIKQSNNLIINFIDDGFVEKGIIINDSVTSSIALIQGNIIASGLNKYNETIDSSLYLKSLIDSSANQCVLIIKCSNDIVSERPEAEYKAFFAELIQAQNNIDLINAVYSKYNQVAYQNLKITMEKSIKLTSYLLLEHSKSTVSFDKLSESFRISYKLSLNNLSSQIDLLNNYAGVINGGPMCASMYLAEAAICSVTGPLVPLCLSLATIHYLDCLGYMDNGVK